MSTDTSNDDRDAALRKIQEAVLRYVRREAAQRDMIAEIIMALDGAGYSLEPTTRPRRTEVLH